MRFRHKIKGISGVLVAVLALSTATPVLADTSKDSIPETNIEKVSKLQQDNKETTQETTLFTVPKNNVNSHAFLDNKTVASVARDMMAGAGGSGRANWGGLGAAAGGAAVVYIGGKAYRNGVVVQRTKLSNKDRKKIPSRDLKDKNHVDMKKFTKEINSKTRQDPKIKAVIQRDRGNNPHGGSYWKLKEHLKAKGRLATLDKNGKILRH